MTRQPPRTRARAIQRAESARAEAERRLMVARPGRKLEALYRLKSAVTAALRLEGRR